METISKLANINPECSICYGKGIITEWDDYITEIVAPCPECDAKYIQQLEVMSHDLILIMGVKKLTDLGYNPHIIKSIIKQIAENWRPHIIPPWYPVKVERNK